MNIISYLRTFRIGPFAIFDFAASYLLIYFLAPYLQKLGLRLTRSQMLWLTLPVSLVVHVLFGIDTPLTQMFLDLSGGYWVKFIVVGMVIIAFLKPRSR